MKVTQCKLGTDTSHYSGHSFRIGGATAAATASLANWDIKTPKVLVNQTYIRYNPDMCSGFARCMIGHTDTQVFNSLTLITWTGSVLNFTNSPLSPSSNIFRSLHSQLFKGQSSLSFNYWKVNSWHTGGNLDVTNLNYFQLFHEQLFLVNLAQLACQYGP